MNILNEYETIYVARPDLTDDVMNKLNERFQGVVTDNAGTLLVAEDWGKRKLAYSIAKHARGHYIYLNYCGPSAIVAEVEDAVLAGRGTTTFPRKGRPSLSGRAAASPHVGFRVSPELRDEAEAIARRRGLTVSALAREALQEYVKKAG